MEHQIDADLFESKGAYLSRIGIFHDCFVLSNKYLLTSDPFGDGQPEIIILLISKI